MDLSRRSFLKHCTAYAAALGLTASDLALLNHAAAAGTLPDVLWLEGSGCSGCSVSLLNRVSDSAPATASDLLTQTVALRYHTMLMAAAGESASGICEQSASRAGYLLVVEGGVPTAYDGHGCLAWTRGGKDVTFIDAVRRLAKPARAVISVGNCAAYGGISAAAPNPLAVKTVSEIIGKPTINVAGCPPHPDWIVWTLAQILAGKSPELDSDGRPVELYGLRIHDECARGSEEKADAIGIDKLCLKRVGCRGPETYGNCNGILWNGAVNWCVDANAPCIGCTSPGFPFSPIHEAPQKKEQ